MRLKNSFLTIAALALLIPVQARAWTNEAAPVDAQGVKMADPDAQFDNDDGGMGHTNVMHFGGADFSLWNRSSGESNGRYDSGDVRTGDQMYDPAARFEGRQ